MLVGWEFVREDRWLRSWMLYCYPKPWIYHELDRQYRAAVTELRKPYPLRGRLPAPKIPYVQGYAPGPDYRGIPVDDGA